MTGVLNPRNINVEKLIPNYQKGLSEAWSKDLFDKYNNEYTTNGTPFPPPHLRFMVTAKTKSRLPIFRLYWILGAVVEG